MYRQVRLCFGRLQLSGLHSWEALLQAVLAEWQPQLLAQLHRCLGGTVPLRPLVSIGNGVSELVLAPVQTYRDHGRVLRGLRHGSATFARSILVEGISLASQLLLFSQAALDTLAAAREGSWPEPLASPEP